MSFLCRNVAASKRGDDVARRRSFFFHAIISKLLVRAAGLEPAQALRPYGFSYHFGLRRRPWDVRGLDYPFTVARERCRCCPSSLYTFFRKEAWLGVAILKV